MRYSQECSLSRGDPKFGFCRSVCRSEFCGILIAEIASSLIRIGLSSRTKEYEDEATGVFD